MAEQHIHKLQRHRFKTGSVIYFCVLDCNFKVSVPLALGKKTLCWRCGKEFTMSDYSIRLAKPHCNACHKPKGVNQFTDFPPLTEGLWAHPPSGEPIASGIVSLTDRLRAATKLINREEEDI